MCVMPHAEAWIPPPQDSMGSGDGKSLVHWKDLQSHDAMAGPISWDEVYKQATFTSILNNVRR